MFDEVSCEEYYGDDVNEDFVSVFRHAMEEEANFEMQALGEEVRYEHGLLAFDASAGF